MSATFEGDRTVPLPDELSARRPFTGGQQIGGLVFVLVVVVTSILSWRFALSCLASVASIYFLISTIDKTVLLLRGLYGKGLVQVSDEEALAIPDEDLPRYTVLLPVYDEPEIVQTLVEGVGQLDYPADKLDIFLVLEADDKATISAYEAAELAGVTKVLVPPSEPRTKPKACNYAMALDLDRSEYVTIYDAEDVPDPLQLRRAAWVFAHSPSDVASIQARLGYYNERDNLLTKWFAIEYDQWFSYMLSALSESNCIIPLGGTSNHIRTSVLRALGGWDAYNVTEDADLGIRLGRHGYRTLVLDSLTEEEANPDVVNWIRQRSRWYKGYVQTFLVHARRPLSLYRQVGFVPLLRIANLTVGMPVANVLNLGFWASLLVWYAGHPDFMLNLFPGPVYYVCLLMFTVGNLLTIMLGIISTRAREKPYLLIAALLVPAYWILQSLAAVKGLLQIAYKPSYWEKTVHGLASKKVDKK